MTEFRRLPQACGCRRAVFVSLLSLDGGTYELVGHTVRVFPDDFVMIFLSGSSCVDKLHLLWNISVNVYCSL